VAPPRKVKRTAPRPPRPGGARPADEVREDSGLSEPGDDDEQGELFGESEEDLAGLDQPSVFDAVVAATDWTAETLLRQIERSNIELNPAFQRRDAWDQKKKSKFIESLIVGLPIPQIVLAERKGRRGEFIVIDGKQRLLTLQQFSSGSLRLSGLDLRPDLNQFYIDSLSESDRLALETQTIRTVVVRNWLRDQFLYIVFHRLNTSSVPLSPQELRQALHPGPFVSFVNDFTAKNEEFYRLFRRRTPDFRMRDVEILVRYFAFLMFLPEYVGNLSPLLDLTCMRLNEDWPSQEEAVLSEAEACRTSISIVFDIFHENAFRRWNGSVYETPFNRAVFDVMTFYARRPDVRQAMTTSPNRVVEAFKHVCTRPEFVEAITTTTKSRQAILTRLSLWGAELEESLDLEIQKPTIDRSGRIAYT
jgi:Protein of unknown function DUF262